MLNSVKSLDFPPELLIRYPDDTELVSPSEITKLKDFMERYRIVYTAPTVWREHDDATRTPTGKIVVLAGWHVCQAAIELGLEYIRCTLIDDYLTPQQRAHLHLAMVSQAHLVDKDKVRALYETIQDPGMKATTGYDDKKLGLVETLPAEKKRRPGIHYQVFSLSFLPSEAEAMIDALERAMERTKAKAHMIADYADYDTFMKAVEIAQKRGEAIDIAGALRYILDVFVRCENGEV